MFLWYDYLILVLTLLCSTLIGFYFGCFGTKQSTTTEYLFGDKKMKILPIALSLTVCHFSAITLIGVPALELSIGSPVSLTSWRSFLPLVSTILCFLKYNLPHYTSI
ncbi:unnamed protein product [Tenebrio molitor]|nr:unnamed protein product [Tenebrio molitor]